MKRVVTAITTTTIALSGASALTVSADAHEVVKRDTLWGISQKHGTSVEELMGWNKLSSTLIYPGQKISTTNEKIDKPKATVKSKDKSTKSKSDSATYTVVAGDTLSEIAFEYGVTYEELMEWNDLTTTLIYPGQELKVKKDDKKTKEAPTREKVQPKESEEKVESKDKIDKSTQDKAVELEKKEAKQKDEKQDTASKSETKPASDSKSESNQEKPDKKITASSGDTYTVNAGDTLSEIAFAHDVSFDDLMKWNNLSSTIVVPGDTLTVNGSEKQVSDNSSDEQKDNEIKEEPKQKEPKQEEPKQEEPKQEEPEQEEPKQKEPKQEEPKQEEPKQEEPKQEEPQQEESKQEEGQVEEVEVEVEEQEETPESESSSET